MSTTGVTSKPAAEQQGQWNVQVVKGKVTTRCLWNACKALSIGLLLLTLGTSMAIVGYYADQLSIRSETRGNSTVRVKNESRGFHLNNLSYAGPIVMGIGGFIVVAACVMTFEARDSAAKVVPARFKANLNSSIRDRESTMPSHSSKCLQRLESKRTASSQTGGSSGVYKLDSCKTESEWSPKCEPTGRNALTAAFAQLSLELLENSSFNESRQWPRRKFSEVKLNKSPSAPDLASENTPVQNNGVLVEMIDRLSPDFASKLPNKLAQLEIPHHLETTSNNLLLKPNQLQRQAHSMDSTFYDNYLCFTPPTMRLPREQSRRSAESKESFEMELGFNAGVGGSQTSMALDLHECQVTLKVQDEAANKRSDTSRRHLLLRQKPVEDDNEDRYPRCACIPRFLYTPRPEECTKINTRFPKNQHSFPRDDARIFYVEDHTRQVNLSSENIRMCDEKLRCLRKHLPYISPHRSLNFSYDCRVQKETGSECLVHTTKDSGRKKKYPLVRSNARRRKCSQKIEGSLSAEEQNSSLGKDKSNHTTRSASFSPTFSSNLCKSSSSSRNDSVIRSPSPVATSSTSQTATELSKEETLESVEDEIKVESQKMEKQPEEPS